LKGGVLPTGIIIMFVLLCTPWMLVVLFPALRRFLNANEGTFHVLATVTLAVLTGAYVVFTYCVVRETRRQPYVTGSARRIVDYPVEVTDSEGRIEDVHVAKTSAEAQWLKVCEESRLASMGAGLGRASTVAVRRRVRCLLVFKNVGDGAATDISYRVRTSRVRHPEPEGGTGDTMPWRRWSPSRYRSGTSRIMTRIPSGWTSSVATSRGATSPGW